MHYTALYRKYRPRSFCDLVGQQHIAATLRNALCQERVVHAYLFCGPRGTGKTSTAHIMARAVNCLDPKDGEPCGQCEACNRILAGQSLDIIEIDAASNRGIDKMRDLRDGVKYTPAQEKYKVYIIDEVHMLTNEAFNALLKTLEEPPQHSIFILATTEPHQVLPTVLSRCQRFDFHRIGQADIIDCLTAIASKEQIGISQEALALIARRAAGGLRDAIGLLDQCLTSGEGIVEATTVRDVLGSVDDLIVRQLALAVAEQDTVTMISLVDTLVNEGKDLRQILLQLLEHLREELLESLKPQGQPAIPRRRLLQMLKDLVDADIKMKESQSARITFELALLSAARLAEAESAEQEIKPAAVTNRTAAPAGSKRDATSSEAQPVKSVKPEKSVVATEKPQAQKQRNDNLGHLSDPGSLFQAVREAWPQILKNIRKEKVVTYAFLQEGKPLRMEGDSLILGFDPRYVLHMQTLLEDSHRRTVEKELTRFFGRPMGLTACLTESADPPLPEQWFGSDNHLG